MFVISYTTTKLPQTNRVVMCEYKMETNLKTNHVKELKITKLDLPFHTTYTIQ